MSLRSNRESQEDCCTRVCARRAAAHGIALAWSSLRKGTLCALYGVSAVITLPASAITATQPTPARQAVHDSDGDGIPDLLGQQITVAGIFTSDPYFARENSEVRAYLQDDTGAIRLVTSDRVLMGDLAIGDWVGASGTMEQYQGMEQLRVEKLERLGEGVPQARKVPVSELIGEKHSAQLIRVIGELIVPPDFSKNVTRLRIRDKSGEIRVYVSSSLLRDPEFTARMLKGGKLELIGNLEQYKSARPYNSGYRIRPRNANDFHFEPEPPYRAMALAAVLTVLMLTFPGLVIYSSLLRRSAERHATELGFAAENLRKSEEALRISEERYRRLFEQNPHPMWVCDRHTMALVAVNAAALSHYGYSEQEFVAMKVTDIQGPEHVHPNLPSGANPEASLSSAANRRHKKKDGSLIDVEITTQPMDFAGRQAMLVLVDDVTERKKMEEQLRQSQRLEAIGRLAGGIAHDFNNLLTVILGLCELLHQDSELAKSHRAEIDDISHAAFTAANLTSQLLAFSRQQTLATQVLNLNTIVADTEGILRRTIGEDIRLKIRLEPALECINVDRGQIEQVLLNLVVNSRDAMTGGGELLILTTNTYLETDPENPSAPFRPSLYVKLMVKDSGTGIDEDTKRKIFDPFFTTKQKGQGSGLGLSTVYGIVKQSGGFISVESEPNGGAVFEIYFPVAQQTELQAQISGPEDRRSVRGSETILLVEDEDKVRKLTATVLQRHGYRVLDAPDGESALRLAERHEGPVALLLTDVVMPGMYGQEVAKRIHDSRPDTKVLYVSGYTKTGIERENIVSGGAAFLPKPYTPEKLAEKVRNVLDSAGRCIHEDHNFGSVS